LAYNVLTDLACQKAQPDSAREVRLYDGGGLYLSVRPAGSKSWKYKYAFGGVERKLTIGSYPLISLKKAREMRDVARAQVQLGNDPAAQKRAAMRKAKLGESFEEVARSWHAAKSPKLTPRYAKKVMSGLEANIFPYLGRKPIGSITPADVLQAIQRIEARGALVMAKEVRSDVSEVFVWAIASGLCETDPAAIIRKALQPGSSGRHPALLKIEEARDLLKAIDQRKARRLLPATKLASRLLAFTAVRPGVVRLAERSEFENLGQADALWRIPAAKMKLLAEQKTDRRLDFLVPLASQATEVVEAAMADSSHKSYLFPGARGDKPISDSTLSQLYLDAGYRGRHVPHGWRATFSTIMNERAADQERWGDREVIDLMLAHVKGDVEAAYNRAAYMKRRRQIAQEWADMLSDGLVPPEELLG